MSDKEVDRLLFFVANRSRTSARDALMVNLLLYTGVRVSELAAIRLRDVDLLTSSLTVSKGKGGKAREIPLRGEVVDVVREYLSTERKEHRNRESEYQFLTQRAGRMDRDTVNKVLSRMGRETGLSLNPHKFRHTFCTRLVKKGVPLPTVAKLAAMLVSTLPWLSM